MKLIEDLIAENHLEKVLASNLPQEIKQDWQEFFEEYEQKKETHYINSVEKLLALSKEEAEKVLYMEINGVNQEIIEVLYTCKAVKVLFIGNGKDYLHFNVGRLTELRILKIRLLGIIFENTFVQCKDLYHLNISSNQLYTLPEGIGELTKLQQLECYDNHLPTIPKNIFNIPNLQELDCGSNELKMLPENIENSINLQVLDCSHNQLLTLPESIGSLLRLQALNCNYNQLQALPECIGNLTNLWKVDCDGNELRTLPLSFADLRDKLQSFSHINNPFTEMPEIKAMGLGRLMDYLDEKRGRKSYTIPFEFNKILVKAFHKYLIGFGDFILQVLGKEIGWQITVHNQILKVHIEPRELNIEEIFSFLDIYIGEEIEINIEELQNKLSPEELFKRKRYIEDWKWERQTLIRDLEYEKDKNRLLERENQEMREDKKTLKDLFQATQKQLSDFILIYEQKHLQISQTKVNQELLLSSDAQQNGVRTVRMFLASSFELKDEREAIRKFLSEENDKVMVKGQGIYIHIVQWEGLSEHISQDRKQGDYNEELKNCEVFLSLFWTKVGKYTEEEFDLAYSQFNTGKQPYILYTYFKTLTDKEKLELFNKTGDLHSLLDFQRKLLDEVNHFRSDFTNIDNLLLKLKQQLENLPKLLKPKV